MDRVPRCTYYGVRSGAVVASTTRTLTNFSSPNSLVRVLTCRLRHLHLHVISSDLCSPSLKQKKHYNSFHPTLGFFLHIDEVLSWFEMDDASFDQEVNGSPFPSLFPEVSTRCL
jgi:hypothetical protein